MISIPGWDTWDDPKFEAGVKITACAILSPEVSGDRNIKINILEGGAGEDFIKLKIESGDSGWGNPNDPICVQVYGR